MKVEELIIELQKLPKDMQVFTKDINDQSLGGYVFFTPKPEKRRLTDYKGQTMFVSIAEQWHNATISSKDMYHCIIL